MEYIPSSYFIFDPRIKPVTLLDQIVLPLFLPTLKQRHGFSCDFGCDTCAQLLSSNCLIEHKLINEIPEILVESVGWKPS